MSSLSQATEVGEPREQVQVRGMKHTETEILNQAIRQWGAESQVYMLLEEIGELQQAVCKLRRNNSQGTFENFVEELADVELMIDQMKVLYLITPEVAVVREQKLERLEKMLWPEGSSNG